MPPLKIRPPPSFCPSSCTGLVITLPGERLLAEYLNYTCATSVVTVDVDDTSYLAAALLQEVQGNVPWYMTDSIAVL